MSKVSTLLLGCAMILSLASVGCDNGPVGKAINCAQICDKFDSCYPNVDKSDCTSSCKDDASNDDAADCSDCLDDKSCTSCSARCAGVGLDLLFK